ncbi:MAG: metallophosphoesterase family protein [Trueperaceae bacterium]|nr:MAG: metallophosphoesterase family protein [Trueperaceae bacterium]
MRYLILSDIHANALALEAVLEHAESQEWERVISLGDLVGYYTEPEQVVQRVKSLQPEIHILGNHDIYLLDMLDGNPVPLREESIVTEVLEKHLNELTPESIEFLRNASVHHVADDFEAIHGALRNPWEYVTTLQVAQQNFDYLQKRVCLLGHTHVPKIFAAINSGKGEMWRTVSFRSESGFYRSPPKAKIFFNPGSVGQPRDGLSLASYAIFDSSTLSFQLYRVAFDVAELHRSVKAKSYPEVLALRLMVGK